MAEITISTTDSLDGTAITGYLGIVSGEAVIGATVVSDIATGVRDVVGGRSGSSEKNTETGRTAALYDLETAAAAMGADAVVGAAMDLEEVAEGMLWVNGTGTAVTTWPR